MRIQQIFLLALLPALMIGCRRTSAPPKDTLVVVLSAPPSTIDPRRATDAAGSRIAGLMFSSLVRTGEDLNPAPEASDSWTVDNLQIRFHMIPGLRFSNGREVTNEDLEYSFNEATSASSPFSSSFEVIKNVKATDEAGGKFVTVTLKRPSATLLGDLSAIKILPKKEIEAAPEKFPSEPIGTGSYRLKMMDSNSIELEAVTDHPIKTAKTPKLLFKIVRDDQTRAMKVLNGEIDIAQQEFPMGKIKQFRDNKELQVIESQGLSMNYMLINFRDPVLSQLKVRQGLAHAIDVQSIIKHKLDGLAKPAIGLLTPINPYFDSSLSPVTFDLMKAKELVKNVKDTKIVLKTSNVPAAVENGTLIASQLRTAGFNIDSQSFEWATYYADVVAGRFQIAIMRWVGTIDPDLYRRAFHSKELPPGGRNRGGYSNQALDPILEASSVEIDFNKRKQLFAKIQKMVLDDLAIVPLWYDSEIAIAHRRVKGYKPSADGGYWALTEAWKEE